MNRHKFTENIGLKIMALIFAALLWLIVVNIDNPVKTATFRGIPVSVINTEIVTNKGKTYKVIDESQTVNVAVKAKRRTLSKIKADHIVAVADMSALQLESLVPITVSIPGFEGTYTAQASPANLKVAIEESSKKVFPITISITGTPRDGHVVARDIMTTNPEKITIKGPQSIVTSIDKVVALVDISGISRSSDIPAELMLYDNKGNVINQNQLANNLGEDGVTVGVTVLDIKSVPLKVNVSGEPKEGYALSKITYEPETVQVCGAAPELEAVTEIVIPPEAIDITNASEKKEVTIDISPYLPEKIYMTDQKTSNIVVTISFEQEGIRTIEFQVESITIKNMSPDLRLSFEPDSDLTFQFRGTKERLNALDITEAVSIDMKSYNTAGTFEIPVNVDLPAASGITMLKNPTVKVTLTEKNEKEKEDVESEH